MASRPLEEVPDGIRIFVDTNILIYHLLDDDLYGASCRAFLQRVEAQSVTALTSPIVAAETLFVYLRAWIITNKCLYKNIFMYYYEFGHDDILSPISMYRDGFKSLSAPGGTQSPCDLYKM